MSYQTLVQTISRFAENVSLLCILQGMNENVALSYAQSATVGPSTPH